MKPEIRDIALEQGRTVEALKKWRQRGGVPHKWRIPILDAAKKQRLKISERDMEWSAPKPRRQKAA